MSIDNVKRKRRAFDVLRTLLCIFAALISCAYCIINSYERDAEISYEAEFFGSSGDGPVSLERSNYCRDSVYSDLCIIGTIYLDNCKNGKYEGTPELYENMISNLSWFETNFKGENIFGLEKSMGQRGLKIDQSQYNITSIDSDYYYFFVSYGDEFLSNIPGYVYKNDKTIDSMIDELCEEHSDWYYLRQHNNIVNMSKYIESGLGKKEVYYFIADNYGGIKQTSEYLDSDKLLLGGAGVDNYGNYNVCFDSRGNLNISTYPTYTGSYELYLNEDHSLDLYGVVYNELGRMYNDIHHYDPDTVDYIKLINANGGANLTDGKWLSIEEMPDYSFTPLRTYDLTVFMTPKQDILASSSAFINKYRDIYTLYHYIRIGLIAAWITLVLAVIIMTLARPVSYYESDVGTVRDKFFHIDISAIFFIVYMPLIAVILSNTRFYPENDGVKQIFTTLSFAWLGLIISHLSVYLSLEGLVRHIKLYGIKSKPELTITSLWKRSQSTRKGIREKIDAFPFNRWRRSLSVKTRYIIMYAELILTALIIIFTVFLSFYEYGDPLEFSWPFCLLFILIAFNFLFVTIRLVNDLSKIERQTDEMFLLESEKKKGKPIKPSSPLKPLSSKLDEVSDRALEAVEQQVKSEKMKVELVTNVSHDLKTPLTSIISYIDLLEKTELSDEARSYVTILSRKSEKLRDIVQDVFSLAKAVSNIDIELEMIDLAILTRQVIGDNNDSIESSGKELRCDIKPETAKINADGPKLYRVIQNLLDNALKYSMPGTRIYLTLSEHEKDFELTVKNVSETEMNFTAEEIIERFTRGDESRTDGGTGLGLSIAQSFTEACGGRFGVEIDGDIFKATVYFDRIDADETDASPETVEPIIDSPEDAE